MTDWRGAVPIIALACAACAGGQTQAVAATPSPTPSAAAWDSVHAVSLRLMAESDPWAADSTLALFTERYSGTPEASESVFWRALLRLDPGNAASTPRDALAALDLYLAGGVSLPRYEEAATLRRVAARLDALRRPSLRVAAPPPSDTTVETIGPRDDDEVRRLNAELERTQAELERIRRRLGAPRP